MYDHWSVMMKERPDESVWWVVVDYNLLWVLKSTFFDSQQFEIINLIQKCDKHQPTYLGTIWSKLKIYRCDSIGNGIFLIGCGEEVKTDDSYLIIYPSDI